MADAELVDIKQKLYKLPIMLKKEFAKKEALVGEKIRLEHEMNTIEAEKLYDMYQFGEDKKGMTLIKAKIRHKYLKKYHDRLAELNIELNTVNITINIFSTEFDATKMLSSLINTEIKLGLH